jgi:hypothetical protein
MRWQRHGRCRRLLTNASGSFAQGRVFTHNDGIMFDSGVESELGFRLTTANSKQGQGCRGGLSNPKNNDVLPRAELD